MSKIVTSNTIQSLNAPQPLFNEAINQCQHMIQQYWADNPDLYHLVQERKRQLLITNTVDECGERFCRKI